MAAFVWHRRVEFSDTDMAGIVHFTAFFRFMEAAEHAFLRSLGLSLFDVSGAGSLGWPRVACSFEYRAPLRFDDEFEVRLKVARIGGSSVSYRGEVVLNGAVVAVGKSTAVCCQTSKGGTIKAVKLPAAVRAKLEAAKARRD